MTKLYENAFRAVNISLANELADACRELELSPREVIDAAATKPFGFMPFQPGPGVGGHCIPCDPHYLLWQLRARQVYMPLVERAMTAIALRPSQVVERAADVISHDHSARLARLADPGRRGQLQAGRRGRPRVVGARPHRRAFAGAAPRSSTTTRSSRSSTPPRGR